MNTRDILLVVKKIGVGIIVFLIPLLIFFAGLQLLQNFLK